jgi:CHAD domain-containing protein
MARQQSQAAKDQPGYDFLVGYALSERALAQVHLQAAAQEYGEDFDAFTVRTVEAVRPPHDSEAPSVLVELALPLLARLLQDLAWAAGGDLQDYSHLHQVRIAGKRLRYAMEVFAACFAAPFREDLYPRVEEMQEVLGRANDSHVAQGRLAALRERVRRAWPGEWARLQPGIEGLLRYHQRRLPQERRRFLRWWEDWHKGEPESLLTALLPSEAPTSAPQPAP